MKNYKERKPLALAPQRNVDLEERVFCNTILQRGQPVSTIGDWHNHPIVKPYNGRDYCGVSLYDVVSVDLYSYILNVNQTQIGGLIPVAQRGYIVLEKLRGAKVGMYLSPVKGGYWKVTKKPKKKSVGYIFGVDKEWMEVKLL